MFIRQLQYTLLSCVLDINPKKRGIKRFHLVPSWHFWEVAKRDLTWSDFNITSSVNGQIDFQHQQRWLLNDIHPLRGQFYHRIVCSFDPNSHMTFSAIRQRAMTQTESVCTLTRDSGSLSHSSFPHSSLYLHSSGEVNFLYSHPSFFSKSLPAEQRSFPRSEHLLFWLLEVIAELKGIHFIIEWHHYCVFCSIKNLNAINNTFTALSVVLK